MQSHTSIYDSSPQNFNFGGGASDSVIHPAVAAALVVTILLVLFARRKYAAVALFLFIFLVPAGQQLFVGGVHLYCSRILVLVGCARLAWSKLTHPGDVLAGGFTALDGVFLTWALFRAGAGILQFMQSGAVVNQVGFLWDALGMYFLLRYLIQDQEDIERLFKVFAVIAVVVAVEMVREHFTMQDWFGTVLGGVPAQLEVRNGLIRAHAVFQHALIAGTFGAVLLPFFVWLWKGGKARLLAVAGMISSAAITFAASVSTPILAFAGGLAAIFAWPVRNYLKYLRWVVVVALIGLNMVMNAPVWYLIARIDIVGGSTSYHRAELIDLFFKHFKDWWLIGTHDNANWGWDMWDTANQFVNEGERGGIVAFVCFVALIWLSFRYLAKARNTEGVDQKTQWFLWLLGCSLFVHCVAFFGVDYFDQSRVVWYAMLAMVPAATASILHAKAAAKRPEDETLAIPQLVHAFPRPVRRVPGVATVERVRPLKRGASYSSKLEKT
jgi:hypothetical protein